MVKHKNMLNTFNVSLKCNSNETPDEVLFNKVNLVGQILAEYVQSNTESLASRAFIK